MDKLVFYKPAPKGTSAASTIIRVSGEAYNAIAAIEAETGLSISYIASQMILFAAQNAVVKEAGSNG